jgi:tetratricopeptide (TPR) repeat protein
MSVVSSDEHPTMDPHYHRALLLLEQNRYELAEREVRQMLLGRPDDALGHAVLAIALARQEKYREATEAADRAVGLAPDLALPFYAQACVLGERNRDREALLAISAAIERDPENCEFYALAAGLHLKQKAWRKALDAAEQGLALDPESVSCQNLRAMALTNLGMKTGAGEAIAAALRHDPDNSLTHANRGWVLLQQSDTREAMQHFKEAMRLDPGNEWAREGILTALKAQNFVYRQLLRYFFWMSRLDAKAKAIVLVGAWLLYNLLRRMARTHPELVPYVLPLLVAYVGFCMVTWAIDPLLALLLRLHPVGRLAMSRDETRASNVVGGCVLGAISLLVLAAVVQQWRLLLASGVLALLIIPVWSVQRSSAGWPRVTVLVYAWLMGVVAVAGTVAVLVDGFSGEMSPGLLTFAGELGLWFGVLLGLLSTWVMNFVPGATVRH